MSYTEYYGQARYRQSSIPSALQEEGLAFADLRTPEPALLQHHQYYHYGNSSQGTTLTDNLNRIRVEGLNEVDAAIFS